MTLFETDRLMIRPLSMDDLPALTLMLSDPEVMKYSIRGICDEAATRKFLEWCLNCYSLHGFGPLGLIEKEAGQLIGFCGIGPEKINGVEEVNLGYRLARKFWDQGFATEAVIGVLKHAFDFENCTSVVVIIEPEHSASLNVIEKSGFRDYSLQEFHERKVRLYRLTYEDWLSHAR